MKFLAPWSRAYFAYPTFQSKRASTDFPDQLACLPCRSTPTGEEEKKKNKERRRGVEEEKGGFGKKKLIIGNLSIVPSVPSVFAHLNCIAYEQRKFAD